MIAARLFAFHSPDRHGAPRLAEMFGLWRQRRRLAALDDHMLRDIGVTPEAAAREAARPVWDAPSTWLR